MKSLATDDVAVNTPGCLRKCGKGVVFKAFGEHLDPPPKGCFGWYPVVDDEAEAVRAACDLLEKMGGLDEEKKADIETRMAAGERVLTAQEPPKWESRCEACGAGRFSVALGAADESACSVCPAGRTSEGMSSTTTRTRV